NSALHDLETPTERQIYYAIDIINHYLKTIYFPDDEIFNHLDTPITTYESFVNTIIKNIKEPMLNNSLTIKDIVPKIYKLCNKKLIQEFVKKLNEEINSGQIKFLSIVDEEKYRVEFYNWVLTIDYHASND